MSRAAFLLAILAALLIGAPSTVLAAPPNRLEAGVVSPTSGTPATPFQFSVRYVSTGGNPANGVTARIGALELPLQLTSGTATDGTWNGSAVLPIGRWSVTYHATTGKGPRPSLIGPTLTVLGSASPSPNGRPGGDEPAPNSSGGNIADPSSGPSQSPGTGPRAPDKPGKGQRTAEPAPRGNRSEADGPAADDTPDPAPGGEGRAGNDGRRRGGAAPLQRSPSASAGMGDRPLEDETTATDRGDLILLLGVIVAVATIALLGTGWLLASREREDEAAGTGETAVALRRARRRRTTAAVLPAHDPVLAALGLDEADGGPPAPLRGSARGAAPRPRKGPRARL